MWLNLLSVTHFEWRDGWVLHTLYQNNSFIVRPPLQSWPKLCGTLLQNALPRPSIVFHMETNVLSGPNSTFPSSPMQCCSKGKASWHPSQHCKAERGKGANIVGIREKRHSVPHILARIVAWEIVHNYAWCNNVACSLKFSSPFQGYSKYNTLFIHLKLFYRWVVFFFTK